ncbi:12773_t:CDS:1, partial [Gigaspora margarita]
QQHCVPDELHVMLRITDVLFECLFFELSIKSTFNKKQKNNEITIREQIESTIHSIGVNIFKFKEPETPKGKWRWTSLMGPDKLIILNKFPVTSFILGQRGKEIQQLWHDFFFIYKTMRKINLTNEDIVNFELLTRQW